MTRFNFELIDKIDTAQLLSWCREQTLLPEQFNGQPTKRFEHWRGKGVELLNYGKNWKVFNAPPIKEEPLLEQLRRLYYPEANSCLLYYYAPGVGISDHSDKPVFYHQVVLINLIDAQPDLFGEKPSITFRFGRNKKQLSDGDVARFDALVPHGLPPVKVPRYSISFRIVQDSHPLAA